MSRALVFTAMLIACSMSPARADESEPPQEELTPQAQAIVDKLRGSLPADSEPIAMLEHILEGSRLGPGEGWFRLAVSQTRFDWETVRERYDTSGDDAIQREEFGDDHAFARIDRNGDELLTAADFDWNTNSLDRTPGYMAFFMADRDANGKVTREELTRLFEQLDTDGHGFLALDDLREQFQPPDPAAQVRRPDNPSRSTLIVGLSQQEIGSLQPGPALGDVAPDFTLTSLDGQEVTLSEHTGDQPVVLIFGNFTCGPFRSQAGNIEKLYERYKDRAKFLLVYVREAHPTDGWWMQSNKRVGIEVPQPQSDGDRRDVARTCREHLELDMPFLVDTVDDRVGATYSGMPNRLYLIDRERKIAFKNGRGPFGFHPRELEQALILLLKESAAATTTQTESSNVNTPETTFPLPFRETAMPFIQWIKEDEATGEVAEGYAVYFKKRPDRTKVADIIKCFSHRPDFMKQVMDFSWDLHFCDGHLPERVKEMIATLVSGQNRCPYCMHSHAFFLHTHGAEDTAVAALGRGDIESAPITDAEKVLLRFARLLTHESYRNTPEEVQKLRDAGWTEPQIAEAVYITAMFAFFNRVANGFGLEDPKYFEMKGTPDPLESFLPRVGTAAP